jgi:uncharacterized protein YbjT (DUF2867 family)
MQVLVTGATGYVGGELVPRLLARGHEVRCLVRDRRRLTAAWRERVTVVEGRVEDDQAVLRAADGCDLAYFLVHGMERDLRRLVERERAAATAFRDAVDLAGVRRVVYLGGVIDEDHLVTASPHLYARHQVGVELRAGPVPVTELRAGIVIGAGSASFRLLMAGARLPVQVDVPWLRSRTQPIAGDDLLELLIAVAEDPRAAGRVLEVGGPEVLTYGELTERGREVLGHQAARHVPVLYLPPEVAAAAAAQLAGIDPVVAVGLLRSATNDAVVADDEVARRYPWAGRTPIRTAIADALGRSFANRVG